MPFCKKKTAKLWVWRAYDPIARRTIAWVLGRRDDVTCQKLLDKIGVEGKTFVTDDWDGYHRLIPEDQLFTGKDLTVPIEQDNSNIRHFLARFRRRTKVVSKVVEMVDLSLRIYHHFHDNLDAFAEKAAIFPVYLQVGLSRSEVHPKYIKLSMALSVSRYITSASGHFSQSVQAVLAKQLLTESQARWTTRL